MTEASLQEIEQHPDYQVLKRVPAVIRNTVLTDEASFIATIIDLETMGLDPIQDEILEIGLLSFKFSNSDGIISILDTYNELQDPGKPIPPDVQKITGIKDEDVKGKSIDWQVVLKSLSSSNLVICHNARFDRNFLELQTPDDIQIKIKNIPFACTIKDIDWKERGYESSKLDYLNWKLGYFYDGHRAITDCWATINLLLQENGCFDELKNNVKKRETLLCAVNAPFEKKELLKQRKYRWSDGSSNLPKCWWSSVDNSALEEEKQWLDDEIYSKSGASEKIPQKTITAKTRYSLRAEKMEFA